MKLKSLIVFILIIFAIIACGKNISDWQVYTTASNQFIILAEQYETYYQMQDDITKAKWSDKFNPVFEKGDLALTDWRMVLEAGEDTGSQMQAFLSIKSEIIALLYEMIEED